MKRFFCKALSLILIFALCTAASGCSDKSFENQSVSFQTAENISTLDPQLASTPAEVTAVVNCFDGLVRVGENGEIVCAAAESYNVSANGLEYTFKLRKNMLWSDEKTPVTAKDFVFGLTRAVLPETIAPYASLLFAVKNAEDVYNGKMSKNKLGISAPDDETVKITLERADFNLLNSLARPVSMPCNEEYFNSTKGKYGLDGKNIITNGAYALSRWSSDESLIRMSRFDKYNGESKAVPAAVTLGYKRENTAILENLTEQNIDCGALPGENISKLSAIGYNSALFYNTSYLLYISPELGTAKLRKVLASYIDRLSVGGNIPDYYKTAEGIVPPAAYEGDLNYRDAAGNIPSNIYGEAELGEAKIGLDTSPLEKIKLYYPSGNNDVKLSANIIAQNWQKGLNAFVNTVDMQSDKLWKGIKSGDIKLAVLPLSSFGGTALDSLINFKGLGIDELDELVSKRADTAEKYCEYMKAAEEFLIKNNYAVPLYYTPSVYFTDSTLDGAVFGNMGNYIDFKYIKKTVK